jgi:hypothetical protein
MKTQLVTQKTDAHIMLTHIDVKWGLKLYREKGDQPILKEL